MEFLKTTVFLALLLSVGFTLAVAAKLDDSNSNQLYDLDPTFNQELVPMSETENFLDAELLFKCSKYFKFSECLEHMMRKHFHAKDHGYAPLLPELESLLNVHANEAAAQKADTPAESSNMHLTSRNIYNKLLKRSGAGSGAGSGASQDDQLVSFFKNAIAKNMKLKSIIKTTRF